MTTHLHSEPVARSDLIKILNSGTSKLVPAYVRISPFLLIAFFGVADAKCRHLGRFVLCDHSRHSKAIFLHHNSYCIFLHPLICFGLLLPTYDSSHML